MKIPRNGELFAALIAERMKERRGNDFGREAARQAGMSSATWSRMEKGRPCSLHDLTLVLHYLDLTELRRESDY